jgi:flagellar hook-associated protein 1 FlgK
MTELSHSLNIGSLSLYTSKQGINTTAHNISNAQTEGYSRQVVRATSRKPFERYGHLIGSGATVESIRRAKDQYLEDQVNRTMSSTSENSRRTKELKDISTIFSPELDTSLASEMDNFFDAMQSLSANPEDLPTRTAFREAGANLALAFNSMDQRLREFQDNSNTMVRNTVDGINTTLEGIADLNTQIRVSESGKNIFANDLRDQRDRLVQSLSQVFDIRYYEDQNGLLTVRGPDSVLLVDRSFATRIDTKLGPDQMFKVQVRGADSEHATDITSRITGGELKGLLDVRDTHIQDLIKRNDELAYSIVSSVNDVHSMGYGIGEFAQVSERNFFESTGGLEGTARKMALDTNILSTTNAIASASTPEAPGDNINVNRLLKLRSERALEGGTSTFSEFYANTSGMLGGLIKRSDLELDAQNVLLTDLKTRNDAVSGVSLDEEAVNMMKWQTAFTASSKLIAAIDEMYQTILAIR